MNAIDTNIWVYCHDSRDGEKQRVAQELIETAESIALLWQVGCEFNDQLICTFTASDATTVQTRPQFAVVAGRW